MLIKISVAYSLAVFDILQPYQISGPRDRVQWRRSTNTKETAEHCSRRTAIQFMPAFCLEHSQHRWQTSQGLASKMSMDGWWMVQTTVRPVLTVLRTVRITIAAARASRPDVGSSCNHAMCVLLPRFPMLSAGPAQFQEQWKDFYAHELVCLFKASILSHVLVQPGEFMRSDPPFVNPRLHA